MKRTNLKSGEISIWTVLIITIVVILLFVILMPVGHNHTPAHKTVLLSNLRQLSISVSIYRMDSNGLYPPASAMPAVRVVLEQYTKNVSIYEPVNNLSITPQFNFNLAGVSEKLPPYSGTNQLDPKNVAELYSPFFGETRGLAIVFADGHHKFYKDENQADIATAFQGQFDRKGVKLWPADYLAAQDPIK